MDKACLIRKTFPIALKRRNGFSRYIWLLNICRLLYLIAQDKSLLVFQHLITTK